MLLNLLNTRLYECSKKTKLISYEADADICNEDSILLRVAWCCGDDDDNSLRIVFYYCTSLFYYHCQFYHHHHCSVVLKLNYYCNNTYNNLVKNVGSLSGSSPLRLSYFTFVMHRGFLALLCIKRMQQSSLLCVPCFHCHIIVCTLQSIVRIVCLQRIFHSQVCWGFPFQSVVIRLRGHSCSVVWRSVMAGACQRS